MKSRRAAGVVLICVITAAAWFVFKEELTVSPRWQICLNPQDPQILIPAAEHADLLIVDPDAASSVRTELLARKARIIAYLSAGEAEDYREYWPKAKSAAWRLEANPDWPGNYPVDVRHPEWLKIVTEEARRILSQGYAGLFLDTLDQASALEDSDPARFKGSAEAAARIVWELRRQFPEALILVNHAPSLLGKIDGAIDGITIEGLHSRWEGSGYRMSSPEETLELEAPCRAFKKRTQKTVMAIDYCDERDVACAKKSLIASKKAGFNGFVSTKELDRVLSFNS